MGLVDDLRESARALDGAANALAYSLRPATRLPNAQPAAVDTFREAEAFCITCRAVMDEAACILPLLDDAADCVGRAPGLVYGGGRVCNGFDSLVVVLLTLFQSATSAVLEVAGNQRRWLVSPMQAKACFEKMASHHGQLRALYGIVHLAAKIITHSDMSKTLFVDVHGKGAHPELEPARWRAAIKMDDFYGRYFGFHYAPEMRNVLRVVNIARGSVDRAHTDIDDTASPLVKNMTMLGWGWVYSNMVLMSNLGLPIDGVSQIGADTGNTRASVEAVRRYMNLVEEPLVAGVTGLASADIAINRVFQIPVPAQANLAGNRSPTESASDSSVPQAVQAILDCVTWPVQARLMSYKSRPLDLPSKAVPPQAESISPSPQAPASTYDVQSPAILVAVNSGKDGPGVVGVPAVKNVLAPAGFRDSLRMADDSADRGLSKSDQKGLSGQAMEPMSSSGQPTARPMSPRLQPYRGSEPAPAPTFANALADVADSSYLASTIKSELIKLQSNVSTFLGIEEATPASALVIHFHGGGFVSQSSSSHGVYLREWCADVPDAVVLSIDYRLAPESRFPVALNECVYAYHWALKNAERLGTRAERVVFAGDSAGGNLAIAAALKAIDAGMRRPDGICVAYPALYVKVAWSPSRLLSFFDPLLPLSIMELCLQSYLPLEGSVDGEDADENPYLSPVVASAEQLKSLPPVTMVCGSLDPLLDDAVLFAHRLRAVGRQDDVLRIFESMPHGFLNMIQVNMNARTAMFFMAFHIAKRLNVPLRKGSRAAATDFEEPNSIAVGLGRTEVLDDT